MAKHRQSVRVVFAVTVAWLAIGPRTAPLGAQSAQTPPSSSAAPSTRAVIDKYCVGCHNEKRRVGDLSLEKLDVSNIPAGAELWEKVIRKLRTGSMPPAGLPRPDQATYKAVSSFLEIE